MAGKQSGSNLVPGNNLVPGKGRTLGLDQLRKLSPAPQASHAGPEAGTHVARPRRIRRAGRTLAGALSLGAALATAAALALLDGKGWPSAPAQASRPAPPDQGLSAAERDAYWELAAREPARFAALLGVGDDPEAQERNARRFERLLSDQASPGRE